ncbi:MAG: LysR family transcriptional regulator [Pseudomonadota bacterium]
MLGASRISLNAVRIFTQVARYRSIAKAAEVLGVTPGAVSHQVKTLETAMGLALLERRANTIDLTEAGFRLSSEAEPAIALIERSVHDLCRDEEEVVLRVPVTLAVRTLVPALHQFGERRPNARVRIETFTESEVDIGPHADAAICYRRRTDPASSGLLLATDVSRPVLSPGLLDRLDYISRQDIARIPALQCTERNWDWVLWAEENAIPFDQLSLGPAFDVDDAALHGAIAGLGMVLAPPMMTEEALAAGTLVPLPDVTPVDVGRYVLLTSPRDRPILRHLTAWLQSVLADHVDTDTGRAQRM